MVGTNCRWITMRRLLSFLMAAVLVLSLVACSGDSPKTEPKSQSGTIKTKLSGSLSEVAPPPVIQQLSQSLAVYQPQVSIISPQADQVLQDTAVSVELQVQDLPIFQDPDLGMGPHLEVILDNKPYTMVYDLKQPLVFSDLEPGTHTLRVLASTPWHESFKNEGAYAQTTFHIFTKTTDNNPDSTLPLLTYSRPTGSYGAEPIMLDFYLTNAPLHLVAQENPEDAIADWRIRATVNGQSFILDRWQSVYLKGFQPGKNWVQLEFLDDQGNPVKNVFNNTVRLIDYQPKGKDTLSKLIRGEISAVAARSIVEPGAKNQPTPEPEIIPLPSPSPEATPIEMPSEAETSNQKAIPDLEPQAIPAPEVIVPEATQLTPEPEQVPAPVKQLPPTSEAIPPKPQETPKPLGGFLNRFRRPTEAPQPSPQLPKTEAVPAPEITPEAKTEELPEQPPAPVQEPVVIETSPTPESSQPQDESATVKPKLDLKEVFLSPPDVAPPKIIQAPTSESDIPKRFLKKPEPEPEASATPSADSESELMAVPEATPLP